ncbi:uncharacterized protein LOC111518614 [Drosophila willistoni]|uniref:uncharacterized protein LOC111518614 n=1 Tax=Drosophila willistoni TaxID=7260 RepID=UPI000C26C999|nr:uncharacterized protein LOC111518614 [Drosophila willistoni]
MDSDPEEQNGDDKVWSPKAIKLLVSLYLKNKDNFRNPSIRKKVTWLSILDEMKRNGIKGHTVISIDRKFRNLKKTFFAIRKKKLDQVMTTIRWQYYDEMEKIFIHNDTDILQNEDNPHPPVCSIFDIIKEEGMFYNEDDSNHSNPGSVLNAIESYSSSQESPRKSNFKDKRTSQCKIEELHGIRVALERSNEIQQERNQLIRTCIEHMIKKNKI